MGLRPAFKIVANASDITETVAARLISLRLTDSAGFDSDTLEIRLSDHDTENPIALPPTGAELRVSLGYDGDLEQMGMFVVDELELSGWPSEMTIRAKAAVQDKTPKGKASLRTQKSRRWAKDKTLGDVVKKIAGEHGLEAGVSKSLQSIKLPEMAQTDESDLHFLVRLARQYDAVVKPANGKLLVTKIGEGTSASGAPLPTVALGPGDVSSWRVSIQKREAAGQCIAYWHETKKAKRHEVKVGSGEPVRRLKLHYPNKESAEAAAKAELAKRGRGKASLSLSMAGRTDVAAEAKLTLSGFREGVDRQWLVKQVTHTFDPRSGFATSVEGELPGQDEKE